MSELFLGHPFIAPVIELARQAVKERFKVELELEIEKVGAWGNRA